MPLGRAKKRGIKQSRKKSAARNSGRRLEKIIELIERQANKKPGVTIEPRKRLRDKDTNRLREHDVVITYATGHHQPMIIALECRDRSRPVTVEAVEAFHTKCSRTGVHQGVIVSGKGFAKTALGKAGSLGLRCLELREVEQFDWCEAPGILQYMKQLLHVQINPIFDGAPAEPWTLIEGGIKELNHRELIQIGRNALSAISIEDILKTKPPTDATLTQGFTDPDPNFVIIDANETAHQVARLEVMVVFKLISNFVPLQFHRYIDLDSGNALSVAATAELDVGDEKMIFAITGPEDGDKLADCTPRVRQGNQGQVAISALWDRCAAVP